VDASAAVSTTVQPSGTVTLPVGVAEDVNASVNKTAHAVGHGDGIGRK
jgi:hypothetical protein